MKPILQAWLPDCEGKGSVVPAAPRGCDGRPGSAAVALTDDGREHAGLFVEEGRHASRLSWVFVYGTLMRGEPRHSALAPFAVEAFPARAPGRLFHLGEYPGLLSAERDEELVHGELVRCEPIASALEVLDEIEGFEGYGRAGSLYRRALLRARRDDGSAELCWTYVYVGELSGAPRISSGRWRASAG